MAAAASRSQLSPPRAPLCRGYARCDGRFATAVVLVVMRNIGRRQLSLPFKPGFLSGTVKTAPVGYKVVQVRTTTTADPAKVGKKTTVTACRIL